MVAATTGPDRGLLETPQARSRLAGVPDPGRARLGRGRDERSREGGDAGEVAEEVERGSLGGQHRGETTRHRADHLSRAETPEPSVSAQSTKIVGSIWREGLGGRGAARHDAVVAGDESRHGAGLGVHQRGREVAEGRQVLGEST